MIGLSLPPLAGRGRRAAATLVLGLFLLPALTGAVDYVGHDGKTRDLESDLELKAPSYTEIGDLLVVIIAQHGDATITAPEGWHAIPGLEHITHGESLALRGYHRFADEEGDEKHLWRSSEPQVWVGAMQAFTGVASDDPFGEMKLATSRGTTMIAPDVDVESQAQILRIFAHDGEQDIKVEDTERISDPSEYEKVAADLKAKKDDKRVTLETGRQENPNAGPSGTLEASTDDPHANIAITLALRAADSPSPQSVLFIDHEEKYKDEEAELKVDVPDDARPADMMLATIARHGDDSIQAPPGWTALPELEQVSSGAEVTVSTYYRLVTSNEPDSHTWTAASKQTWVAAIHAFYGVDPEDPVASATALTGAGDTIRAPSASGLRGDLALRLFSIAVEDDIEVQGVDDDDDDQGDDDDGNDRLLVTVDDLDAKKDDRAITLEMAYETIPRDGTVDEAVAKTDEDPGQHIGITYLLTPYPSAKIDIDDETVDGQGNPSGTLWGGWAASPGTHVRSDHLRITKAHIGADMTVVIDFKGRDGRLGFQGRADPEEVIPMGPSTAFTVWCGSGASTADTPADVTFEASTSSHGHACRFPAGARVLYVAYTLTIPDPAADDVYGVHYTISVV